MSGSKDGPEDVPALATKPANSMLNGSLKNFVNKSKYIDMNGSEVGPGDTLVSIEPVPNKDGVRRAG